MSKKNFMNVYDQMQRGEISGEKVTKKAIQGVEPKGGKDFRKCTEAYDQIFNKPSHAPAPVQAPQVLTEEQIQENQYKKMGAIHFIKEQLDKDIKIEDVDNILNSIKGVISTL
jgi:hypothetical protein